MSEMHVYVSRYKCKCMYVWRYNCPRSLKHRISQPHKNDTTAARLHHVTAFDGGEMDAWRACNGKQMTSEVSRCERRRRRAANATRDTTAAPAEQARSNLSTTFYLPLSPTPRPSIQRAKTPHSAGTTDRPLHPDANNRKQTDVPPPPPRRTSRNATVDVHVRRNW